MITSNIRLQQLQKSNRHRSVRDRRYTLKTGAVSPRLRVAHMCSHKKQGYLAKGQSGETDQKSPAEYRNTHDRYVDRMSQLFALHMWQLEAWGLEF